MNDTMLEQRTRAFPLGPDNATLFPGRYYRRALLGLREDLRQRSRLLCLVGPAGVGKSMLLRKLRGQLPLGYVGEISQPPLGGLMSRLADGLGMKVAGEDEAMLQRRFQKFFAATQTQDAPVIQIIDDAETLKPPDIALLQRLFDSLNGQILLVGQPELMSLFSPGKASRDLRKPDRIYHLDPMPNAEVGEYIRHRLQEAGFDQELFTTEAIEAVYQYCSGLPRLINLLCFTALASSEFDTAKCVDAECIHAAARQRMQTGSYPFLCSPSQGVFRCSLKQKSDRRSDIQYDTSIFRGSGQGRRPTTGRFNDDGEDKLSEPAFAHKASQTQATGWDDYSDDDDIDPIVISDKRDFASNTSVLRRPGRMLLLLAAGLLAGFVIARSPLMESSESDTHDDDGSVSSSTFAPSGRTIGHDDAVQDAGRNAATSLDSDRQANEVKRQSASAASIATATGENSDSQSAETAKDHAAVDPTPPLVTRNVAPIAAQDKSDADVVDRAPTDKTSPEEGRRSSATVTASSDGNDQQDAAKSLTATQREHIAGLYADRAQYERQAGRLRDAQISIRRGLELAPNDPRLQELNRTVLTALETTGNARQQVENRRLPRRKPMDIIPSSAAVSVTPEQEKITHLYMQRAEYEWRNQRLRDALVSIGYGLEEDPDNGTLLDMREKVLAELNKQH